MPLRDTTTIVHQLDSHGYIEGSGVDIHPGGVLRFCPCGNTGAIDQLPSRGALGQISVHNDHVAIANRSHNVPLYVRHSLRQGDRFTIEPGQADTPMPFDAADIAGADGWVLTVARKIVRTAFDRRACGETISKAWGLDPDGIGHQIMRLLCQHIIDGTNERPPTNRQISEQLLIETDTLHDHLDRLITRFGIQKPGPPLCHDWKRQALIDYALNRTYVSPNPVRIKPRAVQ